MKQVPLDIAFFVGTFLETLLYGVFIVLFTGALYVLVVNRPRRQSPGGTKRDLNWTMLITALLLFSLATGHWIVELSRAFDAFIRYRNAPGGPAAYYHRLSSKKNAAQSAFYIMQTFTGDCFMIYRLYLVWGHNVWITIAPVLMTATMLVGGIGTVWNITRPNAANIFVTTTKKFLTSAFTGTLSVNVFCTVLIAYRVWSNARRLRKYAAGRVYLVPVVEIVVESAAILCICVITTLIFYVTGSNLQFTGVQVIVPTIGITWTLIIVRVGLGVQAEKSRIGSSHPRQSYAMSAVTPVSIRVSRQVENVGDYAPGRSPFPTPTKREFDLPPMSQHHHDEDCVSTASRDTYGVPTKGASAA